MLFERGGELFHCGRFGPVTETYPDVLSTGRTGTGSEMEHVQLIQLIGKFVGIRSCYLWPIFACIEVERQKPVPEIRISQV
ncbi:hypothetical protein G9444_6812 (plasmid) [Rhodococcus erythropolis]|uniref:Uncharacterized protein n=1 Tax=Rhodococcus erythropolis TaxID=1833 RepID=A0A6G9D443_RHOER|nr:hypothetical protein [Rhodococcus sp. IEGM 1304]MDV8129174.1 hypothetical protein [Rhodococcus sp. IEGM 1304]QIP44055.1 hypothetical protein G9444_6812 [Rhodococcus erythropolis]